MVNLGCSLWLGGISFSLSLSLVFNYGKSGMLIVAGVYLILSLSLSLVFNYGKSGMLIVAGVFLSLSLFL